MILPPRVHVSFTTSNCVCLRVNPPNMMNTMRVSSASKRVLQTVIQDTPKPVRPRTSYVCASCRSALASRTARASSIPSTTRTFATISSRRQDAAQSNTPTKETVLPQTYYDIFPDTFPQGPPPKSPFSPDLKKLRKEFLQLQAKAHPDLASSDKKRQAEALSARINEAYKTLSDPLARARYLLLQQGIDVEDESAKLEDNALLMEVMEAREAVDEVEDEEGLVAIRNENNQRIEESVDALSGFFANAQMHEAAQEAIKLRYWMNIEESIHGWEKGQGGGINHH